MKLLGKEQEFVKKNLKSIFHLEEKILSKNLKNLFGNFILKKYSINF